jgi:hypothetical protein
MNFRSTTFLFGLLLGMLWLFGLTVAHKKTAVDASFLLPSLQADPGIVIDSITIQRRVKGKEPEEFQFIKDKSNDAWSLKLPGIQKSAKLETFKIDQIVRQIKDARRSDEAGVTEDLSRYGLDQPATVVTVKGKAPEKKEQEWKVFIGKESADQALMYVNSSDRPGKVYGMTKGNIDSVLFKDPNHLRARRLFEFSDSAAQTIDIKEGATELELKKGEDTNWRFEKPALGFADFEGPPAPKDLPAGAKAPEGGVKGVLAAIGTMRVDSDDDFVPLNDAKLESYGLEEGKEGMRIAVGTLKEKDGKKEIVNEVLAIGSRTKDQNQVFARILGDQGIVKLNAKLLEPLQRALHNPGSLRSMDVVTIDTKKVDAVTLDQKGHKVALLHAEGKPWELQVGDGKLQKANNAAIQVLVDAVQGKREIVRFYDGDSFKKLDDEMKNPTAVVALFVGGVEEAKKDQDKKDAGKEKNETETGKDKDAKDREKKDESPHLKKDAKAAVTLSFGASDKDSVNVQRVLADGTTSRFSVPRTVLDRVVPGDIRLAFVDTALPPLTMDEVDRIVIKRPRETVDIEKGWGEKATRWYFKEGEEPPGKSPSDTTKAGQVVNSLLALQAKKWLHKIDPKEDLGIYGLQKPALEVTLRVHKERPAGAASIVGLLATPSELRGLLSGAGALANRLVGPGESIVLKVGKDATEEKDKPAVYAQRSDEAMLFLLPPDFVKTLREEDLHDRAGVFSAQALVDTTLIGLQAIPDQGALLSASPLVTNFVQVFNAAKVKELKLAVRTREELRTLAFHHDPRFKEKDWLDMSGLQEFSLDSEKVRQVVDDLAALKANRWVSVSGGARGEQKLSPKEATLRVEVILDNGDSVTLTVGAPFENIGYYAQTTAWPGAVFLLSRSQVDPFLQGPAHFAKERVAVGP